MKLVLKNSSKSICPNEISNPTKLKLINGKGNNIYYFSELKRNNSLEKKVDK